MTTVQFDKERLQKQHTTRRDHDDDSSTMEAVEEIELGTGGSSYRIGDVLQESGAPLQQRLTPKLLNALATLDVNGDGVIDDVEIALAARYIQKGQARTKFLKRLIAIMAVCFLLASGSTLAVSIWSNRLLKDVYTTGDALTDAQGHILSTMEYQYKQTNDPFDLVNMPWDYVSNMAVLEFKAGDVQVRMEPSTISRRSSDMIVFSAAGHKLILTSDTMEYLPEGEEPFFISKYGADIGDGHGRVLPVNPDDVVLSIARRPPGL